MAIKASDHALDEELVGEIGTGVTEEAGNIGIFGFQRGSAYV